jgi:dethiobiotin synthetase
MSTSMKSLFVTGTDTGVGKTVVACGLTRGLRARGLDLGVMKPVETGVDERGPLDAQALRAAGGDVDPLDLVCPLRFALPAAPTVAAAAEGGRVDLARIEAAHAELAARHDMLVVEGAGGLLVPLDESHDMADLARKLGLAIVVCARASLGTINHTRLTLEVLEARGLECAGVVISHGAGPISAADEANLQDLRDRLGPLLLGEVPALDEPVLAGPEHFDLDRLTRFLTHAA